MNLIMLDCFSRGGSALVWDYLDSHPELVAPSGETHQVYLGCDFEQARVRAALAELRRRSLPRLRFDGGRLTIHWGLYNPANLSSRILSEPEVYSLVAALRRSVISNHGVSVRGEKRPSEFYTVEELKAAAIVTKNINGITEITGSVLDVVDGCVGIGLVRNGLALLEGRIRRGTIKSVENFAWRYRALAESFLLKKNKYKNYHIFAVEDLMRDPLQAGSKLFDLVGLQSTGVPLSIKAKMKGHYSKEGGYIGRDSSIAERGWLIQSQWVDYVNPEVDLIQQAKIAPSVKTRFVKIAGGTMESLGYDPFS